MLKNISVIIKRKTELPEKIKEALRKTFEGRGVSVNEGQIDHRAEAVVVLGGDGTLLHVASTAYQLKIPLLGINLGGLGFLTEIQVDEIEQALDSLISETLQPDKRSMLAVKVGGSSKTKSTYYALNEAVINKGPLGKIITLPAWADDSFLTTYRGDGLIVSTATGSTAYNLSAGGPILHPSIDAFILTPICPFGLNARPLILPGHMKIDMLIINATEKINLIVDGQVSRELDEGDRVEVRKAEGYLKLIKSPIKDYFTILREKLGWAKGVGI
jgi:NAD+ kinase